jgi:hypothetical protein
MNSIASERTAFLFMYDQQNKEALMLGGFVQIYGKIKRIVYVSSQQFQFLISVALHLALFD